jgi:hypothetical protein
MSDAGLRLARAEKQRDPQAFMFVGVFGMEGKFHTVLDLVAVASALIEQPPDRAALTVALLDSHRSLRSGHELLTALLNDHQLEEVAGYVTSEFTERVHRASGAHGLRRSSS